MQTERTHVKTWIAPVTDDGVGHHGWSIKNPTKHTNLYTLHFATNSFDWFLIKTLKAQPDSQSGVIWIPDNCHVAIMYHGEPDDFVPERDLVKLGPAL